MKYGMSSAGGVPWRLIERPGSDQISMVKNSPLDLRPKLLNAESPSLSCTQNMEHT